MVLQPRRNTLTKRNRGARRWRRGAPSTAVTSGTVACRCWSRRPHSAFQAPVAVVGKAAQATGSAQPR